MFTVEIVGTEDTITRLGAIPDKAHNRLAAKIASLALMVKNYIVQDKLSGQVLNRISGNLASSIQWDFVTNAKDSIIARVYSAGVNYAAIHEYGGPVPDRYPVNAEALHFYIGGKEIFAKFARGFQMPERSYMRSGLADKKGEILSGMEQAVGGITL